MVKQRMDDEGLQMSDFMLKRLALLLKKTGQPIPFDEPPVSNQYTPCVIRGLLHKTCY